MAEFYTYTKKRKEFGKHPYFNESKAEVFGYFPTSKETGWQYEIMNPNFIDLDNIPELSEHIVNTERVSTTDKGMYHHEGGWPAGLDPSEITETVRFKKKIEKEASYTEVINRLTKKVEVAIQQNNQIDMFEEYFDQEQCEHQVEQISAKTLMLFKDQNSPVRRTVSDLSWYPETACNKIAVGYSILRFQQAGPNMPVQAYVWDMSKPNVPDITLNPTSAVSSIAFNHKLPNIVGMGCANGLVQIGDILKSGESVLSSTADNSHSAPISKLSWLSAKSGSELITTSTDGKVLWWDTRKLSTGPVDTLNIIETYMDGEKRVERQIGGTSLEYLVDAGPNKFLVGTEQGSVITASKRANKPIEIIYRYGIEGEYHLGPVYQVHRSPPNYRFFLTVGDWGAKVWNEDLKSPIIRTRYHGAFLSDGCFSPVRPGLFFLIRKDGWLDIWDYYYRQNELAFSHKVSEVPLSCIKLNFIQNRSIVFVLALGYQNGKYACIGDQDGTVTIMELCESLYSLQPNEKEILAEMFDRETRKEKALEQKHKAEELKKQAQQRDKKVIKIDFEKKKQDTIQKAEASFYKIIQEDKKYYEEQLQLNLTDKQPSKVPYQQQQPSQEQISPQQQYQQQQEEEELQQIEKEPSLHKEEEKQLQEPVQQQQEPEIQQEKEQQQQPEEVQKEQSSIQQVEQEQSQLEQPKQMEQSEQPEQPEQPVVQEKQQEEQEKSPEQEQQPAEQQQEEQEEVQPVQEAKPQEQS